MLGASILLGREKTLYDQNEDLDGDRYKGLGLKTNIFTYLTAASSIITGGIFALSFIEMIRYFNRYSSTPGSSGEQNPVTGYRNDRLEVPGHAKIEIIKAEVRF